MDTCKNYQKCPIYSGVLKDINMASKAYRAYYCDAGEKGWGTCKRYMVKEKVGKVPEGLLPNSHMTVDEIIRRYQLVAPAAPPTPAPGQAPQTPVAGQRP